uniref:Putative high-affinity choline transporter 1 isoform x2 n=1 Tax=Ixodes scapularis TaxID=6945 RepID=A0A4D5RWQ0_IXOSC
MVGILSCSMALTTTSVYGLWYLSSDLVYVILFPQLVAVVYLKDRCNTYGSLAGYVTGGFLRAAGGEALLGIPPYLKYPFYDEGDGQLFPFRTFSMIMTFTTLIGVSRASSWCFDGRLSLKFDVFGCFGKTPPRPVHLELGSSSTHEKLELVSARRGFLAEQQEQTSTQAEPPVTTEAQNEPYRNTTSTETVVVQAQQGPSDRSSLSNVTEMSSTIANRAGEDEMKRRSFSKPQEAKESNLRDVGANAPDLTVPEVHTPPNKAPEEKVLEVKPRSEGTLEVERIHEE